MLSPQTHPVAAHFALRVLGACEVEGDGTRLDPEQWPRKAASLLRLLAVTRDRRLTRDEVIERLWPASAPEAGINTLKSLLHRLRHQLARYDLPSPIVLERGWVTLNPRCWWDIDTDRLLTVAERAGDGTAELEQTALLLRGEPLPEDLYEEWAIPIRQSLTAAWRRVCLRLTEILSDRREHDAALSWAQRVYAFDPLDEEAAQHMLRALLHLDRRAEAVRVFRDLAACLQRELGIGPSEETRRLIVPQINLPAPASPFVGRASELDRLVPLLDGPIRLLTLVGPGGVGKTRLALELARQKSLSFADGVYLIPLAPVQDPRLVVPTIAEVLGVEDDGHLSPLRRLQAWIGNKHLLLVIDNCEHLLDAVSDFGALLSGCPQIVLLVTSRTVLRLAAEHLIEVPPLATPNPSAECDVETLGQYDAVALFAARARARKADFVLTSENAAAVAAICRYLDGLPLAIELAAARVPLFSPQKLLTRLTNGLQLLTSGARDLPERLQTLRSSIDWSYDLLDESERTLFARLSVFVGGCTLDACAAVCAPDLDESVLLARLTALMEQSLLTQVGQEEPRFAMLETLREYALERLTSAGEGEELRRRHADYFAEFAVRAAALLESEERGPWLARLEEELGNVRASLAWEVTRRDPNGRLLLTAASLTSFWVMHGHEAEGRRWLERALARPSAPGDTYGRAQALHGLAEIILSQGDRDRARQYAEESVALWRRLGAPRELALAAGTLARTLSSHNVASVRHEYALAQSLYEESLACWREVGDTMRASEALHALGMVALRQGDPQQAATYFTESLALLEQAGSKQDPILQLGFLSVIEWVQGDVAAAHRYLEKALAAALVIKDAWSRQGALHDVGWFASRQEEYELAMTFLSESARLGREQQRREGPSSVAWTLNHMGDVARAQCRLEQAANLYEESLVLFQKAGHGQGIGAVLHNQGHLALTEGDTERARALFSESLVLFRDLDLTWSVGDCLAGLAGVAAQAQDPARAARLFSAAAGVHSSLDASGVNVEPANRAAWDRDIAAASKLTDESCWADGWEAGRTMTVDDAAREALGLRLRGGD